MNRPPTPLPDLATIDPQAPVVEEAPAAEEAPDPAAEALTTITEETSDTDSNVILLTEEIIKEVSNRDSSTLSKRTSSSEVSVISEDGPISDNNDEINKSALKKVKDHLEYFNIKVDDNTSIMFLLKTTMEIIESIKDNKFKGKSKKDCVLYVVRTIIINSSMSDDKKTTIITLIDNGTICATIDIIIDASKGNMSLNKKTRKRIFKCIGLCSTGLSK